MALVDSLHIICALQKILTLSSHRNLRRNESV